MQTVKEQIKQQKENQDLKAELAERKIRLDKAKLRSEDQTNEIRRLKESLERVKTERDAIAR